MLLLKGGLWVEQMSLECPKNNPKSETKGTAGSSQSAALRFHRERVDRSHRLPPPFKALSPGLLLFGGAAFPHLAAHAGQDLLECILSAHFLAATFILAVFMLEVAGAAAYFLHIVSGHDHDGVIGRSLTARAVVVDIITEPWHELPPGRVWIARILARPEPAEHATARL